MFENYDDEFDLLAETSDRLTNTSEVSQRNPQTCFELEAENWLKLPNESWQVILPVAQVSSDKNVPNKLFDKNVNLEILKLNGNPLYCDCLIKYLGIGPNYNYFHYRMLQLILHPSVF